VTQHLKVHFVIMGFLIELSS